MCKWLSDLVRLYYSLIKIILQSTVLLLFDNDILYMDDCICDPAWENKAYGHKTHLFT